MSLYILHLSDLHFSGKEGEDSRWYGQLSEDLTSELQCPNLDFVIVSGDIANHADESEYEAARQFLYRLCLKFNLQQSKVVIVPGNHDVNWNIGDEAYQRVGDEVRLVPEKHQQRFKPFADFYRDVRNEPYRLDYQDQGILYHFPEQRLLILGLNSAWKLDRLQTQDADINPDALNNALTMVSNNSNLYQCLKIAVWHHPLNSPDEDRIRDHGFMERLAKAGFQVVLHGHVHQAQNDLYRYDLSAGGRKLDIISAGTFGAPPKELRTGYPWQYNLLELSENKLTVKSRRREELNGAWKPDARWLRGAGQEPSSSYEVAVSYAPYVPPLQVPPIGTPTLPSPESPRLPLDNHYLMLAKAITEGKVVPFLGADINLCGRRMVNEKREGWRTDNNSPQYPPSLSELADYLDAVTGCVYTRDVGCELCDIPVKELPEKCPLRTRIFAKMPLQQVSQYLMLSQELEQTVYAQMDRLFNAQYSPNPLHQFLAGLPAKMRAKRKSPPYQLIVTACFDGTLETAFRNESQEFDLISFIANRKGGEFKHKVVYPTHEEDFAPIAEPNMYGSQLLKDRPVILRIYGGLDVKEFVIREDQYIDYLGGRGIDQYIPYKLLEQLQSQDNQMWFLGYSPSYWNLRVIFHRIWPGLADNRSREAWWAIQENLPKVDGEFWKNYYDALPIGVPSLEDYITGLNKAIESRLDRG